MTVLQKIQNTLAGLADDRQSALLAGYFKTGPGEYGEGDRFRGIRVPRLRRLLKQFPNATPADALTLLQSTYHEDRLFALLLMVERFRSGNETMKTVLYRNYMENTPRINSWDLVDLTAEHIVGGYLHKRSRRPLYRLVRSPLLWDRRIGLLATFHFIKKNDFSDTLALIEIMMNDLEDLIHKAMGWMLREIGKRDLDTETAFLRKHLPALPRTTLRYAIERFPEKMRLGYLKGTV